MIAADSVESLDGVRDELAVVVPEGDLHGLVRVGVVELDPVASWREALNRRAAKRARLGRDSGRREGERREWSGEQRRDQPARAAPASMGSMGSMAFN